MARVVATLAPRRRLQSEPSITRGGFARASPAKVRLLFEEREKRFRPRDSCHAFDPLCQRDTPENAASNGSRPPSWRYDEKRESRSREKKKERENGPIALSLFSTCHDRETEEESSGERDGASRRDTIHVKKMGESAASSGHDPSTRNAGILKEGIFDRSMHALEIEKTYVCRLLKKETRVLVSKIRIRPVLVSTL